MATLRSVVVPRCQRRGPPLWRHAEFRDGPVAPSFSLTSRVGQPHPFREFRTASRLIKISQSGASFYASHAAPAGRGFHIALSPKEGAKSSLTLSIFSGRSIENRMTKFRHLIWMLIAAVGLILSASQSQGVSATA